VQLPRLARFFQRYSGKPPSGYEDFAEKLLSDSSAVSIEVDPSTPQQFPAPFLEYSIDALAILEHIALLTSKLTFE
jgi:hypothetical protein